MDSRLMLVGVGVGISVGWEVGAGVLVGASVGCAVAGTRALGGFVIDCVGGAVACDTIWAGEAGAASEVVCNGGLLLHADSANKAIAVKNSAEK